MKRSKQNQKTRFDRENQRNNTQTQTQKNDKLNFGHETTNSTMSLANEHRSEIVCIMMRMNLHIDVVSNQKKKLNTLRIYYTLLAGFALDIDIIIIIVTAVRFAFCSPSEDYYQFIDTLSLQRHSMLIRTIKQCTVACNV
jgi:hypothetical protein